MNEAQGEVGRREAAAMPRPSSAPRRVRAGRVRQRDELMLVGASNLWFPATQSIIVMPESAAENASDLADRIRLALGDKLAKYGDNLDMLRDLLDGRVDVTDLTDDGARRAVAAAAGAAAGPRGAGEAASATGIPSTCSSPSGTTCSATRSATHHEDPASGLTLSKRTAAPTCRPRSRGCWPSSGCARSTRWSASPGSTPWTGSATCRAGSHR